MFITRTANKSKPGAQSDSFRSPIPICDDSRAGFLAYVINVTEDGDAKTNLCTVASNMIGWLCLVLWGRHQVRADEWTA